MQLIAKVTNHFRSPVTIIIIIIIPLQECGGCLLEEHPHSLSGLLTTISPLATQALQVPTWKDSISHTHTHTHTHIQTDKHTYIYTYMHSRSNSKTLYISKDL
jgi:hypothetical protein